MIPDFPMTVAERMDQFCKKFDVEPCKLRYSRRATDSVVMTDELLKWHQINGASLDWICIGSVSPMMTAYRNDALRTESFSAAIRPLSEEAKQGLLLAMTLVRDERATIGEATAAFMATFDKQ